MVKVPIKPTKEGEILAQIRKLKQFENCDFYSDLTKRDESLKINADLQQLDCVVAEEKQKSCHDKESVLSKLVNFGWFVIGGANMTPQKKDS